MGNINFIHNYSLPQNKTPIYQAKRGISFIEKIANFLTKLAKISAIVGVIFLAISFAPSVAYNLFSDQAERISGLLASTAEEAAPPIKAQESDYQPRFDASLPKEGSVKIASIGVDSQIHEATLDNYEDALEQGIWRVSDFGTPFSRENPTILVAHRYGYLSWSNLFRRKSSFYSLPKTEVGDTIEVVWRQRKYTYAVYGESEGEEIEDYSADLILYTCESLNSPVRIFKYARLLEI